MKQTAVQWFHDETWKLKMLLKKQQISVGEYGVAYYDALQQALEMEKQQTIDFADNYVDNCVIPNENMAIPTKIDVPTYYKETYEN